MQGSVTVTLLQAGSTSITEPCQEDVLYEEYGLHDNHDILSSQGCFWSEPELIESSDSSESTCDEHSFHDQCRADADRYLTGNSSKKQTEKTVGSTAPVTQRADAPTELESVNQTSSVNGTSSSNISNSECVIVADSSGVNFVCTTFPLRGSVTEGAIPDGETRELHIIKHARDLYQSTIEVGHFISDVYECWPHQMKFNTEILLQFPCQTETSSENATSSLRRCLIYSNTHSSESPNWVMIKPHNDSINYMITGEMCHLFVSSFCLFGVIEYNIPVKYVDMIVFGKFYQEASICKLTVVLTQQMDDTVKLIDYYGKRLGYGHFITKKPIHLVKDVDTLVLGLEVNTPDSFHCIADHEEVKTHYLWKDTNWSSTFGVKFNSIQTKLFQGRLSAKHDGDKVDCFILESFEQMKRWSESSQHEIQTGQPVEHSSESVIPKVIYNTEPATTLSNESMKPKVIGNAISSKELQTETLYGTTRMYGQSRNCEVKQMKLPDFIKHQIAEVLDDRKDDGTDWRALANQLGYKHYNSGFYTGKTKHLLRLWEAETGETGRVEYIIEALIKIKQQSLAMIIENFCKSENNDLY